VLLSYGIWGRDVWNLHGVSNYFSWNSLLRINPNEAYLSRWAHEICSDDNEERAIVIATMNEMAYVVQAWLPLIVWQQIDAPQYNKGFITASVLSFLLILAAFLVKFLFEKESLR
jgi:hypothetical protein